MAEPGNGRAVEVRLSLLEERMNTLEKCHDDLRERLEAMNSKLTTILVSVATAAVLLAMNLVVSGFGR